MTAQTAAQTAEPQDIQLVRLMNDLIEVMEREITMLEEHMHDELPDVVSRKQRLLVDYQSEFKAATEHPEWLNQLPARQKSTLRALGAKLASVAERNGRMVKVAMTATQRLLQSIMASVRDENTKRHSYRNLAQPNVDSPVGPALFKTTV